MQRAGAVVNPRVAEYTLMDDFRAGDSPPEVDLNSRWGQRPDQSPVDIRPERRDTDVGCRPEITKMSEQASSKALWICLSCAPWSLERNQARGLHVRFKDNPKTVSWSITT